MDLESKTTHFGQERGKELEFRVLGINETGEGQSSNTIIGR